MKGIDSGICEIALPHRGDAYRAVYAVKVGTGNVFTDFGDADSETKKLKAVIAAEIIATLNARKLTARAAAELAKVDAADIQRIRNADLSRFTIDRLVRVACRLGRKVELKVLPAGAGAAA